MEMGDITKVRVAGEGTLTAEQTHAPITPYANEKITHALDEDRISAHDMEKEGGIYEVTSLGSDSDTPSNLVPFPELPGDLPEDHQFTFRAVAIGCCLGAVVSASNIYLGLKTGWTFGPSLFGSILGFAILKPLSEKAPVWLGGGYFGPKENVCCQTAATSAGGLGIIFVGAIPAMYQLNLLSSNPEKDIGKLITFTACTAYYGLFFAIALRKFYILKLKLIFPSPTAVAYVVRALHAGGKNAQVAAKKKAMVLAFSFTGAALWRIVSQYAPGIMWDWHIFYWFWEAQHWNVMIAAESWSWWFELTPAFLGAGILSGLNASLSFFGGSVLAWGLIGPLTIHYGATFGKPILPSEKGATPIKGYMNYNSLSLKDPVHKPSPRYYNLWIGVMVMLCASFAEIGMNAPLLYRGMRRAVLDNLERIPATREYATKHISNEEQAIPDPSPRSQLVPAWMWSGGVLLSIFFSCLVLGLQFHINVGITILSVILAFCFSFIAAQSSGATDINPVSTCGKSSQLVLGGVTQGQGIHGAHAQRINMTGGVVSAGAAAQSVDMLGDLRTGYLLGASPRVQFYAQAVGSFFSVFLCTGFFILFAKAYPCIIDAEADTCQFGIPSVSAWVAIAKAVTGTDFPIPQSSAITALVFGLFSVGLVVAKYKFIHPDKHYLIPNMNAVGLAFTLPQTFYSTAMAVGAIASYLWLKKAPKSWNDYAYSLAAGLSAGEGIGGVVNALFQVAGISGTDYGSAIGCPGLEYCG
ncbi:Putative uncharacterized protein [Taphrina deformans PYCC 5710]|uniref:Oligopeptide transporter n=1 Tax=Taphrina deformans (strain PYCC 5710 / ATCC 11124 / CBS 356.35 / IMI 108563 / JCM 9778 / NBRC 8474) TaxID=1097556 RepID=R4XAH5_TAPDE|nr:Putative uncharacterized protein [Taphrina deformans PYCC 5710]|eukprot:CCG82772.1 Putative uncharacterized protein [Taphrina deformans PYCC 5710]